MLRLSTPGGSSVNRWKEHIVHAVMCEFYGTVIHSRRMSVNGEAHVEPTLLYKAVEKAATESVEFQSQLKCLKEICTSKK